MDEENAELKTISFDACQCSPVFISATLEKEAAIFKALGHPVRLAMVHALADGPRCVCELHSLVKAASAKDLSTVSRHLSTLQQAGIIRSERRGTNIYYSLSLCCLGAFLKCTGLALQEASKAE